MIKLTKHKKAFIISCMIFMILCGTIQQTYAIKQDPPFFEDTIILAKDSTIHVTADSSGTAYDIPGDSALAALIQASNIGGFDIYIDDTYYDSWGTLFISEIAGQANEGFDGWQYWLNYPDEDAPMISADANILKDDDMLDWFYGGYGVNPDNSNMRIILHIEIIEDTTPPEMISITPKEGGIYLFGSQLTLLPLPLAMVIGEMTLSAQYTDANNIHRVEFYLNDELLQTDYQDPYEYRVQGLGTESYNLKTVAYDSSQNKHINENIVLFISN